MQSVAKYLGITLESLAFIQTSGTRPENLRKLPIWHAFGVLNNNNAGSVREPEILPASRSSFGAGQVRKRAERPLNQPSQYFSVFDSSTRQVKKLSFFIWMGENNLFSYFSSSAKQKHVATRIEETEPLGHLPSSFSYWILLLLLLPLLLRLYLRQCY